MNKSDFFYNLPEELIAQTPIEPRNASRLLVASRDGIIKHDYFYNLRDYLCKGDLLVMNDSRVIPARIYGVKQNAYTGGDNAGATAEFLLLRQIANDTWETIVHPGKRAKNGAEFDFGGIMQGKILYTDERGNRHIRFNWKNGTFFENLDKIGQMPLPPYIHEKLADRERYQTVYSKVLGSAAAPTAGLHFIPSQLEELRESGIDTAFVTLHVGLGTFRPVAEDDILKHFMHTEHYSISAETAEKINRTKRSGGRVICVGTTSARTLESACSGYNGADVASGADNTKYSADCRGAHCAPATRTNGADNTKYGTNGAHFTACEGDTDIFIYPGYKFKAVDALITNFHLPESTLIMLVSAFLGYENTMNAYKTAVSERYRFFSFGDAMFIN
jgi:S-adenosylmethionine:tRNA ribosyltransferase-isomerase